MKHFDTLGVMIDCSRDSLPNVARLKQFFDAIAKMGYNMAMLYTEDTYEVEDEPYFGYKRGRYTADELRELDGYARSVGIELIPCIQTLAHLGSLKRWRAYRHKVFDIEDILLVDEPKTYELIERMIASVAKVFSGRRLHIGMDEAHHIGLGVYRDRHGAADSYELLMRHLNRVNDIAKKYGFEIMMANDLFFSMSPGVFSSTEEREFPAELLAQVPPHCGMVYWDYFCTNPVQYNAMMRSTQKLTDNVWFSGGAWTWNNFTPHNRYSMRRNAVAIPCCIENGVRQAFFCLWGDNGGECPYESVLPALMHIAALGDDLSEAEMKAKFRAITGEDFDAMMDLDLPNYIFGEDVPVESPFFQRSACNYAKTHLYDDVFYGTMSANIPEVDEARIADFAERLHRRAAESKHRGFLFEAAASLVDVMEVKYNLAKKTRRLYHLGDRDGLRKLAEEDYNECLDRLQIFYEQYRHQWFTVNKPYGFEIQDARLGGLSRRLEHCRDRLLDYADGKTDRIDELEEGLLPLRDTCVCSWAEMISASVI